jgi:hypothetical protein
MDQQLGALAWKHRLEIMKPDPEDPIEEYLPRAAQDAQNQGALAQVLQDLRRQGYPDEVLRQILSNWLVWDDYRWAQRQHGQGRPGPSPVAPVPMQPVPRSQQLPPLRGGTPGEPRSK